MYAGTMSTTLSSPLYPLYANQWGLIPSDVTWMFVCYMIGALGTLLFLGRLVNTLGYARLLRASLVLMLVGLLGTMFAPGATWLSLGRVFLGIGVGCLMSAGTLGMIANEATGNQNRAMQFSSIVPIAGFGSGPLVAGLIAQLFPLPFLLPYVPTLLLLLVCLWGISSLRAADFQPQPLSIRPRLVLPAKEGRALYMLAAIAAFCVFFLFSTFASLVPSVIIEVLAWQGTLATGTVIFLFLGLSMVAQIVLRRYPERVGYRIGISSLGVGTLLIALFVMLREPWIFVVGTMLGGIGHGASLMNAIVLAQKTADATNRAAVLASFYAIAYVGAVVPTLLMGFLANQIGIAQAMAIFALLLSMAVVGLWYGSLRKMKA